MRIFDLDQLLGFALYPHGNKALDRDAQQYVVNVDAYCKNGSTVRDDQSIKRLLAGMKFFCLGVDPSYSEQKANIKLVVFRKKIQAKGSFTFEQAFRTPNSNLPLPLVLIYKKLGTTSISNKIRACLQAYYLEFIRLHVSNEAAKKNNSARDGISKINSCYKQTIADFVSTIFQEIGQKFHKNISILGLLLDPYFISKKDHGLYLQDTRPEVNPTKHEPKYINDSNEQFFAVVNPLGLANSPNATTRVLESDRECIPNTSPVALTEREEPEQTFELNKIAKSDTSISITPHLNDSITQNQNNSVSVADATTKEWPNLAFKEAAKHLIVTYQKHLAKKYCFRSDDHLNDKQAISSILLKTLREATAENFFNHLDEIKTKEIFAEHRDLPIMQKVGMFFKRHEKTKGTQLLEKLFSGLTEEDVARKKVHT